MRNPKVFLFDEPLSNLDAKVRVSMRSEISKLHNRLGVMMIYVTHDQVEAMTMGDRICVMKDGEIMQVAEPLELYNAPNNMFVAGFIGSPPMNFLHGQLLNEGGKVWFMEKNTRGNPLRLCLDDRLARLGTGYVGKNVVFGIRPEDISDASTIADAAPHACAEAAVEVSEPMGAETYPYLDSGAHSFIAKVHSSHRYAMQQLVRLHFAFDKAHLFDPQTELVIHG